MSKKGIAHFGKLNAGIYHSFLH